MGLRLGVYCPQEARDLEGSEKAFLLKTLK